MTGLTLLSFIYRDLKLFVVENEVIFFCLCKILFDSVVIKKSIRKKLKYFMPLVLNNFQKQIEEKINITKKIIRPLK
jgi:hypothetical protein